MARAKSSFICQSCGAAYTRWQGRCDACGEWNAIVEELVDSGIGAGPKSAKAGNRAVPLVPLKGETESAARIVTGIAELDRVTGGGFVMGSALLVGGDPGIGKSTLLLQAAAALAARGRRVVYVSGEEAVAQVRLRAQRLGLGDADVHLAAETNVEIVLATLEAGPAPHLVIVDSIQTLWTDRVESAPGTVTQVRTSAQALTRFAKKSGAAVVLVGHVTKDGQIAGPRVVEHMVDAVLYFEGDSSHTFRILRGVKNRYGATDEIGVFEMTTLGLSEVANPSALFLDQRDEGAAGSAVFAGMEGTRPVLVEIQALVAPSPLGTPRRAVVGWDSSRLSMVLAVLETRCGVRIGANDIYLNVAGGLRIAEPAADLAVAAALISSLTGSPLPNDAVYFGEISLAGGVRPVVHAGLRLREAQKLGFAAAHSGRLGEGDRLAGLRHGEHGQLLDLVGMIASKGKARGAE
ncbi:DNA repair protein RadA/Sms [Devosia enhydra]|uniref:DNA repair protein RadA n=1 Tax=Devosia enhydra TaxID=665118 RepID=A0A1K2HV64_9HYPH|nr:DNA repair protein RadA [Devosia enhydra]SFZ81578.1 DNA repair protein RadA/Sms [Devosia enhydra]